MSCSFNVYMNERLAGQLFVDDSMRMSFCYAAEYIELEGTSISLTLPVVGEAYSDALVFPFVENLLPEGEIRQKIQDLHKIEDGNYERLLDILGGDVAGAISFYPQGVTPSFHAEQALTPLSESDLSQLLLNIQDRPFHSASHEQVGNRLSLAGAQNKLPVIVKDSEVYEAGPEPSTHIIKPARKDGRFPSIVYNEYICMKAAKRAGIDVADVSLLSVINDDNNESDALLIKRFDRYESEGKTIRLPQEDLCQLNSIVSTRKYEVSGGSGFIELFSAIKAYSQIPALDDLETIRRIIFNLVIGNYDAHGKNFSLLINDKNKIWLSPAYDLVCTQLYEELDTNFAMSIDGIYELKDLTEANFVNLFSAIGKKYSGLKKQLIEYLNASVKAVESEVAEFVKGDFYQSDIDMAKVILATIKDNEKQLRDILK
ncbi:type II toxin-antitoxin system HipA family toxin [Oceaniserpentilla sp. 4NH20-0058]|uniref:HipA domain-containing protein n=1 Tax=Oceaniserpentilla sp. 4NH20-0058 TaxID=3127660 RepID=UPI0031030140